MDWKRDLKLFFAGAIGAVLVIAALAVVALQAIGVPMPKVPPVGAREAGTASTTYPPAAAPSPTPPSPSSEPAGRADGDDASAAEGSVEPTPTPPVETPAATSPAPAAPEPGGETSAPGPDSAPAPSTEESAPPTGNSSAPSGLPGSASTSTAPTPGADGKFGAEHISFRVLGAVDQKAASSVWRRQVALQVSAGAPEFNFMHVRAAVEDISAQDGLFRVDGGEWQTLTTNLPIEPGRVYEISLRFYKTSPFNDVDLTYTQYPTDYWRNFRVQVETPTAIAG